MLNVASLLFQAEEIPTIQAKGQHLDFVAVPEAELATVKFLLTMLSQDFSVQLF
jgi:hypothetical protein